MPNKKMKEGVIMDPTETNEPQKKDILSFLEAGKMKEEADHYSSHYLCFASDRDAGRFTCYSRK